MPTQKQGLQLEPVVCSADCTALQCTADTKTLKLEAGREREGEKVMQQLDTFLVSLSLSLSPL